MSSRTTGNDLNQSHPFSPRKVASAVMLALASLSANVDAAGLGRLTVQSALGQPLRAEVEVTSVTREEAQSLSARLASADAFRQAGLEYNPALSNLRFAVEQRGGRYFVRITSNQPVNEPFVDLLVELNWASGKFVREYTFLLDPPELRTARESVDGGQSRTESAATAPAVTSARPAPAPAAAPAAPPRQAAPAPAAQEPRTAPAAPAAPEPAAAAAASAPPPAARATPAAPATPAARAERARPEPRTRAEAPAGSVEVRRGDTLGGIARNVRPEGVTLDQTIMAIYQANPAAFMGSINLVREGANLAIPDRGTIAAVDAAAASREVRVQIADYVAYRNRLASAARSVEPGRTGQTAAGQIGAAGTDRTAGAPAGDRLELSKPGAAPGAGGAPVGSQARRAGAAEQGVARDAAAKEAGARIATLEKNVADLQKLLELKNKSLADLQKQLDDAKTAGRVVTGQVGATPPPVAAAPKVDAPKLEAPKLEAPKAEAPKAEVGRVEPPAAIPPVAAPSADATRADAPKAAPRAEAAKPAPAPVAEASFMDELLDNPFVLPGLGGLALLGAGYGWYAVRRRKKVEKFEDSLIAADAFTANSLFGSTGGQSVDTSNSVFANANASTAVDVHSTEVDPIAEADVYIAYGREAQAEEILKEALKRQPERQAIRQKLLEIYSGRKDAKAFEAVAREMHDMTGGQNEEWPKVVALGLALDPANPLYGGAGAHAHDAASATAAGGAAASAVAGVVAGSLSATELDFPELKVGSFDEPSAQPASAHPSSAPYESFARSPDSPSSDAARVDSDEIPSLDFDLDIDTKIERAAGAPGAQITDTITDTRAAEPVVDLSQSLGASFDLPSLDLGDKPAVRPPASGASIGADLDLDLASLGRLSEPMQDEPAAVRSDAAHGGGGARESAMRASTPHEPTLHEPTIDLSPISLDLEPATMGAEEASFGAGGSGRWQEMATKLDLASAYEEIGDKEGARELLQEVVKGGDSGQQQKARAMLGKIG